MNEVGLSLDDLDTPALWVDLDRLESNIAAMAGTLAAAGMGWRPHTKGIKVPAIAHKLLAAGAHGVTCAKISEAEVMAAAGITDILVANQVVGARKIVRLVNLRRSVDVKAAVDDVANVDEIGALAAAAGVQVGLLIEVDTGMQRAGVAPGAATLKLAEHIERTPGVWLAGLMGWEGHTLTINDPEAKAAAVEACVAQLVASADLCRAHGLPIEIVSAGGSGTYLITSHIAGVTELQAGGGIFGDLAYQNWGVPLEPAAFLRATVTSRAAPDRIITDCGFKTAMRGYPAPAPLNLEVESITLSAEHGIYRLRQPDTSLRVGDCLDLRIGYLDATTCLHECMVGVRNGYVESVWEIVGRGKLA